MVINNVKDYTIATMSVVNMHRNSIKTSFVQNRLETRIWKYGKSPPSIVVESYSDKNSAIVGHQKWIATIKTNHPEVLYDIRRHEWVHLPN